MNQDKVAQVIERLGDGSCRVRVKSREQARSALQSLSAEEARTPYPGVEVRILARSGSEVDLEVWLSREAYSAIEVAASHGRRAVDELVVEAVERALGRLKERSPEEAIELTRAFIEANRDWLGR